MESRAPFDAYTGGTWLLDIYEAEAYSSLG